jgi:hypothetical protein
LIEKNFADAAVSFAKLGDGVADLVLVHFLISVCRSSSELPWTEIKDRKRVCISGKS